MARRFVLTALLMLGPGAALPSHAQATAASPGSRIQAANDQLLNQGNLGMVEQFFSADYVNHSSSDQRGPASIREFVKAMRTAFPDLRVNVEILLEQGDRVAWRRTHRGTFKADFIGMKATGRELVWYSVSISRLKDGRIVEEWGVSDLTDKARR